MLNTALHNHPLAYTSSILSVKDEAILIYLNRYHYLSASQVQRLLYSNGSLTYVQARLKRLVELSLLQRLWLPRASAHGSTPSIFRLARKGLNHLQGQGVEVMQRYRPSDHDGHAYLFLNHALALNDFLISAELDVREAEEIELAQVLHDEYLKRRPTYVERDGRRTAVIPDAWLDFRIKSAYQVCLAVEMDMGTEEQKRWRRKVGALVAFANGPYEKAFNTKSLTIAVVSAAGEKRMRDLVRWTEAELSAAGEEQQANLFIFTESHPALPQTQIFSAPRWWHPFGSHAVALLESLL